MTRDGMVDGDTSENGAEKLVPRVPGQEPVQRASARTVGIVIVVLAVFLYLVRAILLPFVVAGAAAYVCQPLVERLTRLLRVPRWVAAVSVCLAILSALAGLAWLGVPSLIIEAKSTLEHLPGTIEQVAHALLGPGPVKLFGHETDAKDIASHVMNGLAQVLQQSDVVAMVAGGGVAVAFGSLFTLVLLFYLMIGGPTIARGVLWLVPPKQRPLAEAIWRELDPVLFRYFASLAIVVTYATLVAYIGLAYVLHLEQAGLLALLTGLFEIVPIVGPVASALIAGLFAVRAAGGPSDFIAYVIYTIVLRLSIDQVVSPIVLGRAGRVHPTVIIFSFLAGGALFNIVGIILAIPVALTIKTILAVLYEERPAADVKAPASRE